MLVYCKHLLWTLSKNISLSLKDLQPASGSTLLILLVYLNISYSIISDKVKPQGYMISYKIKFMTYCIKEEFDEGNREKRLGQFKVKG